MILSNEPKMNSVRCP